MSFDQYKQSLIESVRAGVMTEYEANASIIRNNLAQAMSELQNELAALEPLYQTQLGFHCKEPVCLPEREPRRCSIRADGTLPIQVLQ